ncbi:MAG: CRISPR-associated protein Cas4 [Candidatus Firestonebacteria bacterium]
MIYDDEDLLALSGIQHYSYCKRQCAFIHIESIWFENVFTAEGRIMHENVHKGKSKHDSDVKIETDVPIRSYDLGLIGKADVIEYSKNDKGVDLVTPIEYKRGKTKTDNCDRIQLCAQAICLEEMMNCKIEKGYIFYGRTRRREEVFFSDELRKETTRLAVELHEFIKKGFTSKAEYEENKCDRCSFLNYCMPKKLQKAVSADKYFQKMME